MDQQIIANGGSQYVPQIAVQYVYLDFDGELTSYNGEILTVDNVEVKDSSLTEERITYIVAELNAKYYAQNVIFVSERPTTAEYSTIYIGKTEAFSPYGNFAGLAETIDFDNQNKTDKAFVMLNANNSNEEIIETISHETNHLLGTLDHGGEGINAYASDDEEEEKYYTYYHRNQTYTGGTITSLVLSHYSDDLEKYLNSANQDIHYYSYDSAYNVLIWGARGARCLIYSGGFGENLTVSGQKVTESSYYPGNILVNNGGSAHGSIMKSGGGLILDGGEANYNKIYSGGWLTISHGKTSDTTVNSSGHMYIYSGGVANSTTVNEGGDMRIYSGGGATEIVENGGYVYVADGANVTFASNTINGFALSGGSMTIHSNTVANSITVNSGGSMFIYSGGVANSTTVNKGGDMYIYSGGLANSTTVNSSGYMYISSDGLANSTTVNKGGDMYIYSGVANSTTVNEGGYMYISSGGVHSGTLNIESGGVVYVYSGSIISIDLTDRSEASPAVINDISRISGAPTYTINVTADISKGKYKLAGNAADFTKDINITVNGSDAGVFKYDNGSYSSIKIGDEYYTLALDKENNLCLKTLPCISIDYSIDEIDQIVYYHGEREDEFDGVVMKVPYSATATITLDKDTPDGVYEFVTVLDGIDKAEQKFTIQVLDGMPVYDSSNMKMCIYGTKLSETAENSTWAINVNDFVLTEKIQKTMTVTPKYGEDGGLILTLAGIVVTGAASLILSGCSSEANFIDKGECDANKEGYYYDGVISCKSEKGIYTISIKPGISKAAKDKLQYDIYNVTLNIPGYNREIKKEIPISKFDGSEATINMEFPTFYELGTDIKIKNGYIYVGNARIAGEYNWNSSRNFAYVQKEHCWIAVTANMLYKGGYLGNNDTAQDCFEHLSKYFFQKHAGSESHSFKTVLDEFSVIPSSSYQAEPDNDITARLESLKNGNIAYISLAFYDPQTHKTDLSKAGHAVTCFSFEKKENAKATVRIADSDKFITDTHIQPYTLIEFDDVWYIQNYHADSCPASCSENHNARIKNVYILMANTDTKAITVDYKSLKYEEVSQKILAKNYNNIGGDGSLTLVIGSIEEAIVEDDGILEIADGATGDTIILHDKAVLNLKSGAVVRGEIMTHGGTISTESGVLFEEAEINFVISMLDGKKEAILDDLGNVGNMPLNVTVMARQSNGEYILADGADGFNGEITIHGEYGNSNQLKMGFDVGELGTLKVGEKLKIGDQVYSLDIENNQLIFRVSSAPLAVWNVFADITYLTESAVTVSAVFSDDITVKEYSLDGTDWKIYDSGVVISDNVTIWFRGADANGNYSDAISYDVNNIIKRHQGGTAIGLTMPTENGKYLVEYSKDNFKNYLQIFTTSNQLNTYGMANGCYNWQFWEQDTCEWGLGNDIVVTNSDSSAKTWLSNTDGNMDVFFANASGKWGSGYAAQHTGILNGWDGTNEQVTLYGKNKLADIFEGSSDANILVMTDDTNGDALFVDDIYTALPGTINEQQARIAQIDEIRAGNGNDIVDMTSQRFAYIGDGVNIYGGLGNDTIWTNNGNNALFGDAGNDRLVGGANNDVIVGGIGNDRMHGGGGDDIFTFGNNWGNDTIEQLDGGEITLWFESGEMSNWNADTLTYTDGENSVTVSGVNSVTLKFGNNTALPSGCFDDAASEKIFEDKNKGMLA